MDYKNRFREILSRIYSQDNAENNRRAVLHPNSSDDEIWKICRRFWGINNQFDPQHPENYNVCENLDESFAQRELDRLEELLNKNDWM